MKFNQTLKRIIAGVVITSHAGVLCVPAMAKIEQEAFGRAKPGTEGSVNQTDIERLRELVKQSKFKLSNLKAPTALDTLRGNNLTQQQQRVKLELAEQILALRAGVALEAQKAVAQVRQEAVQLKAKKVSAEILKRQEQTALLIEQRQSIVDGLFNKIAIANSDSQRSTAVEQLMNQLSAWEPKEVKQDFKNLPWGETQAKSIKPVTAANFKQLAGHMERLVAKGEKLSINPLYRTQADAALLTPDQLWQQSTRTVYLPESSIGQWQKINFSGSTLNDSNKWQVLASMPKEVQAGDLSGNEDVQITPEIRALAKELKNNPAAIYKWVYDNITYVPSYGSIQGSAYTLETKRGNAFDTSSLLIALLRASGIPARYVYGTVDIPATAAKDWVGGVNSLSAASQLSSNGGIPNIIVMNGSKESVLRQEHVWVEAKLDYLASKGAVQNTGVNNPAVEDSWIPLDASYKRYERTAGIDLKSAVPFDAEGFATQAQQGATVDEATGSVKNINAANIESGIKAYQQKVETYLKEKHPNATVGDIVGQEKVKRYKSKTLSPVLPYQVVSVLRDFNTLPDTVRHYFVLYAYPGQVLDQTQRAEAEHSVRIPTTQLQGKGLAVSFRPSSESDAKAIASLIPKADANGNIDPSKLPKSLSSSIKLTGEVTLGGQVLKTLSSYSAGAEVRTVFGFESPNFYNSFADNNFTAGEYNAIGYNLQGISDAQFKRLKSQLEQAKAKIESKDAAQIATLTGHDVTGAMLQSIVQGYFAVNDFQADLQANEFGMVRNNFMSIGRFFTAVDATYMYGVLRSGAFSGMAMDIDRLLVSQVQKDGNNELRKAYNQLTGAQSSLNENLVPEQFFNDPNALQKNAEGVSAVKILKLAAESGQTIYQIDQSNIDVVLPKLKHSAMVLQDVKDGVAAGKVVTISESSINFKGWVGSGYTVLDKATGAGAYMISGGMNGGFLVALTIVVLAFGLLAILTAMTGGIFPIILGLIGIYGWVAAVSDFLKVLNEAKNYDELNAGLRDIVLPIVFGLAIARAIKGLAIKNDYEEDLFVLIVNDIVLNFFYTMFD